MKRIVLLPGFFLIGVSCTSPQIGVEELFARMEKRPQQIESARFNFVQKFVMRGQVMEGAGEGTVGPDGKLRLNTLMSTPVGKAVSTLISDGQVMWHEIHMGGKIQVIKYDLPTLDADTEANIGGLGIWGSLNPQRFEALKDTIVRTQDIRILDIAENAGTPVYLVEVRPKPQSGFGVGGRTEVLLGVEDVFIRAIATYDEAGNSQTELILDELEFNVEIEDTLFAYIPPEGVAIEDGNAMLNQPTEVTPPPEVKRRGLLHNEAPDFTLEALEGKKINLKSLRGKTVLIDFWATWCAPCLMAMPHIQKIHEDFKEQGLVVLGINSEPAAKARNYMERKGYNFTNLIDEDHKVSKLYQVRGLPTTLIIDKEGVVQHYLMGYRPERAVRAALAQTGVSLPGRHE